MCGIFGYIGRKNNALQLVLTGLQRLEYRGYDSWGIAYPVSPGKVKGKLAVAGLKTIKRTGKIGKAKVTGVQSNAALGHTRWATHGGVTVANAHPHLDCTGSIAVVHNGIIENFQQLKKQLRLSGHRFVSTTDTEIIAHQVENYLQQGATLFTAAREAFLQLQGRNAVVIFSPAATEEFAVVKNGTPLAVGKGADGYYLASDAAAFVPYVRQGIFLPDGVIAIVRRDGIKLFTLRERQEVKIKWRKLTGDIQQAERGKFAHFFLKEVMDQRNTLAATATQSEQAVRKLARLIRQSYGTYFIGAGSAYYACLAGVYIFSKVARRHINVVAASEFPYVRHFIRPDSLVIGISQSGETADVLEAVDSARNNGARIGAIVNVASSTLARSADTVLPQGAGIEKAVVATKSFTSMLAALYLLAFTLIGEYKRGKEMLLELAKAVAHYLAEKKNMRTIAAIAKRISREEHIFTLGRGLSYPIALEGALKIKEASYLHAEGFAGGELKHGVIALVDKKTPFLVFVPHDETKTDIISNIMEVKARGANIIAVAPQQNKVYDSWIAVPDVGMLNPIMSVIPAQLFAYYLTLERGLDPDKPRNLAKSVTVK